jgi:flagellar biosynthesis/type III secretory pathway protein FliH
MIALFKEMESNPEREEKFHPFNPNPILRGQENHENSSFIKGLFKTDSDKRGKKDPTVLKMEEAKDILKEAKLKAELIEKEAYEKAYFLGEKAGKEMAFRKFQSLFSALEKAKLEMDNLREKIIKRSESDLIRLCIETCKKVIAQEIEINNDIVVKNIKLGIRSLLDSTLVKVRVHPSDLEKAFECMEEIKAQKEDLKELIFEADERIGKGGAVIETSFGEADCRIERRMNGIENLFMKILKDKEVAS